MIQRNQSGQAVIEAILIITILFGAVYIIAEQFKSGEYLVQLVEGPWQQLSGVIQNGVWMSPEESMKLHPSAFDRHISIQGDAP